MAKCTSQYLLEKGINEYGEERFARVWSLVESILFNEMICEVDEIDLTKTPSNGIIVMPNDDGRQSAASYFFKD